MSVSFFFGPSFWISLNIFRSMCRTILIFFFTVGIVLRLISYKTMGLYSQGNPFSWKIIMGTFLALILNFSTVGHGGAYGVVRLILAYEAHGFTSILEKRHIFKATWGAFMGGGDFWHTWGGRWGGVPIASKAFFNSKIAIFWNGCYFDH